MKSTRLTKITAAIIVAAMLATALCSCGSQVALTLNGDNGVTYTASKSLVDFIMVYVKQNTFISNGWHSGYDIESIWTQKYDGDTTFDQYLTSNAVSQLRSMLVEEYLFDKYSLTIDPANLAKLKEQKKSLEAQGRGAYKQYYGFTTDQLYEYLLIVEKSGAVNEYLYGENGTDKVNDSDKETYYTENFKGYQYIMFDMNNKVVVDEDGNKVRTTTTDKDGNTTENDEYKTEKMTDEEKDDKAILPDTVLQQIKAGGDFAELAEKYSDSYLSVKYKEGVFVTSSILTEASAKEKVDALEIGDVSDVITVGDGEYSYIVKRVPLIEKVYDEETHPEYAELFENYTENVQDEKYSKLIEKYIDSVTMDEEIINTLSMQKTYLSKSVNYAYQQSYYSNN
ncbi:MAG: peptidylprolyl isomerase [Clostridia bacterium]|nr:peptidylprolyl isomerase [Clostridia bacterium]